MRTGVLYRSARSAANHTIGMKSHAGAAASIVRVATAAARLVYVGHATVLVELDGVRLLTDPVLRSRVLHLRRRAPVAEEPLRGLTAVLVSHVHYDHFDRLSLRRLGTDVPVVLPRRSRRLLWGFSDVREVEAGDELRFGAVTVRAVPAEHASRRPTLPSTPSLGYVVSGSRRVYFAGDTDLFPGMADLAGDLDVALLPVAGWGSKVGAGHLDPERAARAAGLLRPRLAVPIHWGTLSVLWRDASSEAAEEFVRRAAELAPGVEVRVLRPGDELGF
jgi:L-ascorbate metabolism protein UlaG (beta-lactamase superfamily)